MLALLVAAAIVVEPIPAPHGPAPATELEAARLWLEALRDHKADDLAALTSYPFRYAIDWRPHESNRPHRRRLGLPESGWHESCPSRVKTPAAMSAWLTCVRKGNGESVFLSGLVAGRSIVIAPARGACVAIAGHSYFWDKLTIRLSIRPTRSGPKVARMIVTGDYSYDEGRLIREEQDRRRDALPSPD